MKRSTLRERMNAEALVGFTKINIDKASFHKIQEYVAFNMLWQRLHNTHTNEDLNHLMVRMMEIEEEVMDQFGLPYTHTYSSLFQFLALKEDFTLSDINKLFVDLHREAEKYFSSPVQTDIKLLESAIENQLMIDEVLPQLRLRLKAEPYYQYLYEELLLHGKITAYDFLVDATTVAQNELSILLNRLAVSECWILDDDYPKVAAAGLKCLHEFLDNYKAFREKDLRTGD